MTSFYRIASTSALVTASALLIALIAAASFSSFQRPASPRPDPLSLAPEPPPPPAPVPPLIDYSRKWALIGSTGYFNFTDSEWAIISDRWPVSGHPAQPTAALPQGPVTRLNASTLATMIGLHPEAKRTNRVWFTWETPAETHTNSPVSPAP